MGCRDNHRSIFFVEISSFFWMACARKRKGGEGHLLSTNNTARKQIRIRPKTERSHLEYTSTSPLSPLYLSICPLPSSLPFPPLSVLSGWGGVGDARSPVKAPPPPPPTTYTYILGTPLLHTALIRRALGAAVALDGRFGRSPACRLRAAAPAAAAAGSAPPSSSQRLLLR